MGLPEAEVLIPHHNRAPSLRRTLEALRAQTRPAAIAVVDNGSTDGSLEMLEREFPEVRVVALGRNLGFGAAVNRGLATASAPVVIPLNNDAVADRRFVELLLERRRASGAEMVAACLRAADGTIESLGVEVDRALVAYDVWHGEPYERLLAETPPEPLAPSGGAAAYDRAALAAVGGFDERLFAYLEDVELGIRMRLAGMSCACEPLAFAWHEHSGTLGSGAAAKNRLMGEGRAYLLWKHGAGLGPRARARGLAIDGIVYAGQAVFDRNLAAVRGRIAMRRRLAGRQRPAPDPRLARLPLAELPLRAALRVRLARRRPRASPGRRRPSPRPGARA